LLISRLVFIVIARNEAIWFIPSPFSDEIASFLAMTMFEPYQYLVRVWSNKVFRLTGQLKKRIRLGMTENSRK